MNHQQQQQQQQKCNSDSNYNKNNKQFDQDQEDNVVIPLCNVCLHHQQQQKQQHRIRRRNRQRKRQKKMLKNSETNVIDTNSSSTTTTTTTTTSFSLFDKMDMDRRAASSSTTTAAATTTTKSFSLFDMMDRLESSSTKNEVSTFVPIIGIRLNDLLLASKPMLDNKEDFEKTMDYRNSSSSSLFSSRLLLLQLPSPKNGWKNLISKCEQVDCIFNILDFSCFNNDFNNGSSYSSSSSGGGDDSNIGRSNISKLCTILYHGIIGEKTDYGENDKNNSHNNDNDYIHGCYKDSTIDIRLRFVRLHRKWYEMSIDPSAIGASNSHSNSCGGGNNDGDFDNFGGFRFDDGGKGGDDGGETYASFRLALIQNLILIMLYLASQNYDDKNDGDLISNEKINIRKDCWEGDPKRNDAIILLHELFQIFQNLIVVDDDDDDNEVDDNEKDDGNNPNNKAMTTKDKSITNKKGIQSSKIVNATMNLDRYYTKDWHRLVLQSLRLWGNNKDVGKVLLLTSVTATLDPTGRVLHQLLASLSYRGGLSSSILSDDDNPNDSNKDTFTSCPLLLDLLKRCHLFQSKHDVYSNSDRGEEDVHDNKEGDGYSLNNGINNDENREYKRRCRVHNDIPPFLQTQRQKQQQQQQQQQGKRQHYNKVSNQCRMYFFHNVCILRHIISCIGLNATLLCMAFDNNNLDPDNSNASSTLNLNPNNDDYVWNLVSPFLQALEMLSLVTTLPLVYNIDKATGTADIISNTHAGTITTKNTIAIITDACSDVLSLVLESLSSSTSPLASYITSSSRKDDPTNNYQCHVRSANMNSIGDDINDHIVLRLTDILYNTYDFYSNYNDDGRDDGDDIPCHPIGRYPTVVLSAIFHIVRRVYECNTHQWQRYWKNELKNKNLRHQQQQQQQKLLLRFNDNEEEEKIIDENDGEEETVEENQSNRTLLLLEDGTNNCDDNHDSKAFSRAMTNIFLSIECILDGLFPSSLETHKINKECDTNGKREKEVDDNVNSVRNVNSGKYNGQYNNNNNKKENDTKNHSNNNDHKHYDDNNNSTSSSNNKDGNSMNISNKVGGDNIIDDNTGMSIIDQEWIDILNVAFSVILSFNVEDSAISPAMVQPMIMRTKYNALVLKRIGNKEENKTILYSNIIQKYGNLLKCRCNDCGRIIRDGKRTILPPSLSIGKERESISLYHS